MKRAIFFIFLTMLAYKPTNAQVFFEDSSFDEALSKAKREGKMLFLIFDVTKDDKQKKDELFANKNLGYLMNHKFVNYQVNDLKGEGKYLILQYKIKVLPTMMMLNNDGTELSRSVSVANYNPHDFISTLNSMTENSISSGREKFRKSLDGANQFVQLLNDNYLVEERNIALVDLFNRRTKEENYNEENFDFYSKMISSVFHPIVQFTLADKKEAIQYLGKEKYSAFIAHNVNKTLNIRFHQGTITEKELSLVKKMAEDNKEVRTVIYDYYTRNYSLIESGNLDKIIKNTLKIFNKLTHEDKVEVVRFINTISVRENKVQSMLNFYDEIISISKSENDKRKYREAKKRIEIFLNI